MHFLQIVSIALGVSSAAAAATKDRYIRRATGSHYAPRTMASAARGAAHNVKRTVMSLVQSSDSSPGDFVIGDIHTTQAIDPASTTKFLDAISFTFGDINSNTTHDCTTTWKQSNSNDTTYLLPVGPETWLDCEVSTDNTHFSYQFYAYTDLTDFSLRFRHDFVSAGVFHNYTSVVQHYVLQCSDVNGADGCYEAIWPGSDYVQIASTS